MSQKWKDRLYSGIIALVVALVAGAISAGFVEALDTETRLATLEALVRTIARDVELIKQHLLVGD